MSNVANFLVKLMSAGDCEKSMHDIKRTTFMNEEMRKLGCECELQIFGDTANSYCKVGNPNAEHTFCFCGHCDVVPVQPGWTKNPKGEIIDGLVYGRGAVDMLGGVASWYTAISELKQEGKLNDTTLKHVCISSLFTGDEEINDGDGVKRMAKYLADKGEKCDVCMIGEPSNYGKNPDDGKLECLTIERGGSFNFGVRIFGLSGHISAPDRFDNPITKGAKLIVALKEIDWQRKANLEISAFEGMNQTNNVVLDEIKLRGNVRYFDGLTPEEIYEQIVSTCKNVLGEEKYKLSWKDELRGYKTDKNNKYIQLVANSIKKVSGSYEFVGGRGRGCSDGEWLKVLSDNVCEFGVRIYLCHKKDEYTSIDDLENLVKIYKTIILDYIASINEG